MGDESCSIIPAEGSRYNGVVVMCACCIAVAIAGDPAKRLDSLRQGRLGHHVSEPALLDAQTEEAEEGVVLMTDMRTLAMPKTMSVMGL